MPDLPPLELQCFGVPTARLGGRPAPPEVTRRKHLALLVYLALSPDQRRSRSHLVGVLWPEKGEAQARHSLNEAVRRLRGLLGAARLVTDGDGLALDGTGLEVDAARFDALAERDPAAAAELVGGEFLEGLALEHTPAFEEWAAAMRGRYAARGAAALVAAGEQVLASRAADAAERARRALALQPYAEPAAGLLMRAAAVTGDAGGALAAFHDFAARLEHDLGERPSRELAALAERIRAQRWRRPALMHAEEEPPFVGQEAARREALALVAQALQQGPRTLLVTGDPGTGKTRLLVECLERCALEGALTAVATPLESDRDAPWSALRALLRGGLLRAPGSVGADPGALAVLAALVPDQLEGVTPRPPGDHAQVAAALASLLKALAEEQPVALALDEAHYADGGSIEVLHGALAQLAAAPLLLAVTAFQAVEHQPRALVRFRSEVGRGLAGSAVRLAALSEAATRELVLDQSRWCEAPADGQRLARRIFFETNGNPFLVVTLLRGLAQASALRDDVLAWPRPGATLEGPLPISVPGLARRAIVARVTELDEESLALVRAASVGALAVDPELVAALAGLGRERVEDRLGVLERHHLLAFDGDRYVFAAPLIAEVVRGECLPAGQRRTLRARAAELLAARSDPESRLRRAELLAKTGAAATAFSEAVAVAGAALAEGTPRAARRALAVAEQALTAEDAAGRKLVEELRARMPA